MTAILLILMFVGRLIMARPHMDGFDCTAISTCQCTNMKNSNSYEISCADIIVKVKPGRYVRIDCTTRDEQVYLKLPKINVDNIPQVKFGLCPLPIGSSIRHILDRLGVLRTRSIIFNYNDAKTPATLLRQHLAGLDELEGLHLSGNGLSKLPNDLFDDVANLTWLDLSGNEIGQVNIQNLQKLEYLELGNNNLNGLERGAFRNQQNLKHLNLWSNNLQTLTRDYFQGGSSIMVLELSGNNIEMLQPDVFAYLTNLTNINLSANRFASLPMGLFSTNRRLKQIRLMDNRVDLVTLPTAFLSQLLFLEEVIIARCNLGTMPSNLFQGSLNIQNISMESNNLSTLPAALFADQINLIDLDLSNNKLYQLSDGFFENTISIIVLRLSNNRFNRISGSSFHNLINLRELFLDNNNLLNIHPNAFATTINLQMLRLENNFLSFDDISQVGLELGNSSPFQYLTTLKQLNLRNNSIANILLDWNYNHFALEELDLSYNKITRFSYDELQFASHEITVNLSHNLIAEIDLRELDGLANLEDDRISKAHLILDDNPLNCDCMLVYFIRFLRKELVPTIRNRIEISADNLKCGSPERMANKYILMVQPNELLCLLDSPNSSTKHCPVECECLVRPYDEALIMNCSNRGISEVPMLPKLDEFGLRSTELYIENNNITQLPSTLHMEGYRHVVKIYARNNSISQIYPENLPRDLSLLDVSENQLHWINSTVLGQFNQSRQLQSILLSRNPWFCDCQATDLLSFVTSNIQKVADLTKIRCGNGERLTEKLNICPLDNSIAIALSISIALFGLLIGIIFAAYFKYQQEIKVWLYARNLCLWLVTEEDLDKNKKYDAFISFSHKDEDFVVNELVPELENGPNPYKTCLHFRDFTVGDFISNQIVQSVEHSRRTIVVLSPNFLESIWGRLEFRAAHKSSLREGRSRVIVIIYGHIGHVDNLDPELKCYLSTNTYLKWDDPWFFDKLRYALPHRKV